MHLEPTGERMILERYQSSAHDRAIALMHLATYDFAARYVSGKRVLDFGCGSGYGTALTAKTATESIGVDVSPEAIEYAQGRYREVPNLRFQDIDAGQPLPFQDDRFDVVLSFQVIEHVPDPLAYLSEAARVLAPGGVLLMATPDRQGRLFPFQRPWNRWHLTEYDNRGLLLLLQQCFPDTEVMHMGGDPRIIDLEMKRARRLKWATLPLTLPVIPDAWRVAGLGALRKTQDSLKAMRRKENGGGDDGPPSPHGRRHPIFSLDERGVVISPDAFPSANLVAVSRKGPGSPSPCHRDDL